ncbi:hypothetical protein HY493_00265 [Candidatus Woesearchaeota archaeon]|nr:hypothetical protein [Candidatus Woesearchaeota archaeon]
MALTELLVELFDVAPDRAAKAAEKQTEEEFLEKVNQLELLVGFNVAATVVRDGEFIDYRNGQLKEYFSLVRVVQPLRVSWSPESAPVFYSTASLQSYISESSLPQKALDVRRLHPEIRALRLLHRENQMSRMYLADIIEKGELQVGRHEHWNNGRTEDGLRGLNILKKIMWDVTRIAALLGVERPRCDIRYESHSMLVDRTGRDLLRSARDAAYAWQA